MNQEPNNPLVLIVDDDREFREDIGPEIVEKHLHGRTIKAEDVETGLKRLAEHAAPGNDPVALVVVDMHLPLSSKEADVDRTGGEHCIARARLLQMHAPMIVFTAYPSYRNCVASVNAGATHYVPKQRDASTGEGGVEGLVSACRQALRESKEAGVAIPPTNEWLDVNYSWLLGRFPGRWVSFVREEVARTAGLVDPERFPSRGGIVVVAGDSFEAVRHQLLESPEVLQELPAITKLPASMTEAE